MTTYKVELRDDSHYVVGLVHERGDLKDGKWVDAPDTMLLVRYDAGDCDTHMKDKESMHRALYDLYQTHDGLKKGDRFETEFGNFECVSFHVVGAP